MPEDKRGIVTSGGKAYQWNVWADVLKPNEGTESLAEYENVFYGGQAAVTYRRLGTIGIIRKNSACGSPGSRMMM